MLYFGTEYETSQEMRPVLGYDDATIPDKELASCFRIFLSSMEESPGCYALEYANSLLIQENLMVKSEYKSLLEESFNTLFMEVDFCKDSQKVVGLINDWVNNKTHGMIPQLLDNLDPSTVLVLLNAVYFKGSWMNMFPEHSTCKGEFYNNGSELNVKQVDMMHLKKDFLFVEEATFKALEMPYKGNDIAMLVLLPTSLSGLPEVETMVSASFLENLRQEMFKRKINVVFPKFRLEYKKSFVPYLQQLGINRAFTSRAQLGGISDSGQLEVSDILHKAVLVVNEEGCEAAAATAVRITKRCLRPELRFCADRPFLFVIHNVKTGAILFMGKVVEL